MDGATKYHCCSFPTKLLFFGNKCCFFVWFSIFTWSNVNNHEKSTLVAKKQHFCWKIGNNDAILLSASFIASGTFHDDCTQNLVLEVKISENFDFWQFLKIDFELHICCHDYDLSNITNWQNIGGRPSARNFCRNVCLLTASQSNFHL